MEYREIEVRFLEINVDKLKKKLKELGAKDLGEDHLHELIFFNNQEWIDARRMIRVRQTKNKVYLTYKHHQSKTIDGAEEVEIEVSSFEKAKIFLQKIGFTGYREQEKKRHTFKYKEVTIDIDFWPHIPPFVEIEGQTEKAIKQAAKDLGYEWENACFLDARAVIMQHGIEVPKLRYYTFDRIEAL